MRLRSVVGLIPLFAVDTIEPRGDRALAGFRRRMEWFMQHRPDLCAQHRVAVARRAWSRGGC